MTRTVWIACALMVVSCGVSLAAARAAVPPPGDPAAGKATAEDLPTTVPEARSRARILHETFHGVLRVVHRDFFRENQRLSIPARSMQDVFKELAETRQVDLHWLVVNAEPMNVDNNPRNDFEKEAAKALASGQPEFEAVDDNVYRFAGSIPLGAQCQRCHVPRRTGTATRVAGLVIAMPLRKAP